MGDKSRISWTDATWNVVSGCSRVSRGCERCYAETLSLRHKWTRLPWTAKNAPQNVVCHEDRLSIPLKWKRARKIFTCSMGDLFHDQVPFEFIATTFAVMAGTPHHTYQVLTKRPARMAEFLGWVYAQSKEYLHGPIGVLFHSGKEPCPALSEAWARLQSWYGLESLPSLWPLPNVWLGTSVEDQRTAETRIDQLADCCAAVRFLSCEPLLEPLEIEKLVHISICDFWEGRPCSCRRYQVRPVHWVICGGESGTGFRPLFPSWVRSLRDQCRAAGIPFFFKQDASKLPGYRSYVVEEDGSCWEWHQFPNDLRDPVCVAPSASDIRPIEIAKAFAAKAQARLL